ncbi:MAG: porphobilinogen synthase, partial [Deltaproteobacteria bacterium]|nr:porphobilinogen synthase [Deltaproteobacteria bacterium]
MSFPIQRPRRLRENPGVRRLVGETSLSARQLVMPLFVQKGKKLQKAIKTLPGLFKFSPDLILKECEGLLKKGVNTVLLFGIGDKKDPLATEGSDPKSPLPEAISLLKKKLPEMLVIADVCLCDYTDHGHCGLVLDREGQKVIDNDSTLEVLSKISGTLARAGADVIAPSDMMDGRVAKIRDELDAAGFKHVPILSYAVKYASSFYGPFREVLDSRPAFGDRKSYQMDPANAREALKEAKLDLEEGADILMVKPALPYLDVVKYLRDHLSCPLAAYKVSGEYAMF